MAKGWPKGKPRKVQQEPPANVDQTNIGVGFAENAGDDFGFSSDERMKIYQDFAKTNYPDTDTSTVTEETPKTEEKEAKTEEKPSEKPAEEAKKEETVAVTEKTETVKVTETKPEDVRTVPYGALHEERMKRKDLQLELDDMKAKVDQLMSDNVKLMSKGKEPSEDEYQPVYRTELSELRTENLRLKNEIDSINKRFQVEDQEKASQRLERLISEVDKIESDAGRPGFASIGRHIVLARINEMAREDPELASSYQNTDGWRKIWTEEFPKVKQQFVIQDKKELFDQKKQAKEGAELITSTGKAPTKEATTLEWDWNKYLEMRQKLNL